MCLTINFRTTSNKRHFVQMHSNQRNSNLALQPASSHKFARPLSASIQAPVTQFRGESTKTKTNLFGPELTDETKMGVIDQQVV